MDAPHRNVNDSRRSALRAALAAPLPHPDESDCREAAAQTVAWALTHFATLPNQSVGRPASPTEMADLLREPPPEQGEPFAQVLDEFRTRVAPYYCRTSHPRCLAFVPAAPAFPAVLGDWLAAAANAFAGIWLEASGPAAVELLVLDWFKGWFGFPPAAAGALVSGGSEANLTALLVARERLAADDRGRAVLYVTEYRHWSADRAAWAVGLRRDQVRPVPADQQFRLTPQALAEAVRADRAAGRLPWAVVANAGSTNTGTVDPLRGLAALARAEG